MVIVLNKREDSIVVSINSENLVCIHSEEVFGKLDQLINNDLPAVSTMADAKAIEAEVRKVIEEAGNVAKQNFVETACKDHLAYDPARGTYHLKSKGGIISHIPLPNSLVERILTSVEKGIDPTPIVKAVIRFFRNPNLSIDKLRRFVNYIDYKLLDEELEAKLIFEGYSEEKAREASLFLQTPITLEGLLVTYKVSREITEKWALDAEGKKIKEPRYSKTIDELTGEVTDNRPEFVEDRLFEPAVVGRGYDAFYCESLDGKYKVLDHIYRVGCKQYLENWDQVNCDDNAFAVPGLHLGNLVYINSYAREGTVTHNCFLDPMHIGAITDNGDGAIRAKQLFIHSSKAGDNRGIYFSSTYAAHTDEEWETMKEEATKNAEKALKELSDVNADALKFKYSL